MSNEISGNEIRRQFLEFFESKGHTIVRSASLVPTGDSTLLFTNAGMVQFKDIFLGTDSRPYTRACDSQKCMRVAGKHNDLDDVGRDDRHHTFFEMLGNWSFADYYKKEAISWAWELLTKVWGLDPSKLYATVFKDEKGEIPADEEAYEIWCSQPGMDPSHVQYFGRKENFWEMADTGPCGPCSEIHIDLGPDACDMKDVPGHVCQVNGDCARYTELWNNVFIQYNRVDKDTLVPLPHKFVDTGMGFERIVAVLQHKNSNYKTDLFAPTMRKLLELTGKSEEEMYADFTPYRVIADHGRAATFLIADGVTPGNMGRNYICRMIIRRAVRFGQQLGLKNFMPQIAESIIESYGDAYPELKQHHKAIIDAIRWEEDRFNKTLDNGMAHLNEIVEEMKKSGKTIVDGATCFDLHSTYGLPLEITRDYVRDLGFDVDREGFEAAAIAHQNASKGEFFKKMGNDDAEKYDGFLKQLIAEGKLPSGKVEQDPYMLAPVQTNAVMLIRNGEPVSELNEDDAAEIVVPATGFYLEMGGQIGDIGTITSEDGSVFTVESVRKPAAGMIVHCGKMTRGAISTGDKVSVAVDDRTRHDIMRNHTATHLLHAALHQVVGPEARQAGSYVSDTRLRFDFNSNKALTPEQLTEIENIVNENILSDQVVYTKVENINDAISEGVTALFNEKYGEQVRVVRIGENGSVSAELCGGTHVSNTGEIGLFVILSEGSVATGIRRIEAITGREASKRVRQAAANVRQMAAIMSVPVEEVVQKAEQNQQALQKAAKDIADFRAKLAMTKFDELKKKSVKVDDADVLAIQVPDATPDTLREMADKFKNEHPNAVGVFSTILNNQAVFIVNVADELIKRGVKAGDIAKQISAVTGGSGGGRPNMAQAGGKIPEKIPESLDLAVKLIREKLGK